MNKHGTILKNLENEIFLIRNKRDRELSENAFKGHKKRYADMLKLVTRKIKKGKILDVGASPYHIMYSLQKLGFDTWGIDINFSILKEFQRKFNLKVIRHDAEKGRLPFEDQEFNIVIFTEVFEHLGVDPLMALKEIRRILKPKGVLILSTPNLYALHKIIMFLFGRSFNNALEELNKVESTGYMGHIREYSNKEIKTILKNCGYKVKESYFKKYNSMFLSPPVIRETPLIILGIMFEFITNLIGPLRPTQIIVAEKV